MENHFRYNFKELIIMKYSFPYKNPGISEVTFPKDMDVTVYRVPEVEGVDLGSDEIVRKSLSEPIGKPELRKMLKKDDQILLIIDDISRPTPIRDFIDTIIDEIQQVGIEDENIEFLIALGTHRFMTDEECVKKLGQTIYDRFAVYNHEWNNPDALHDFGKLDDGTRVILNKKIAESDLVIGIGSIAPHPAAGFSGGAKIIVPGAGTDDAAGNFHWESIMHPQKEVLGVRDNPMREMIDSISTKAGFDYIVNVIMDGSNKVVDAVSGDPIEAHKVGANKALEIFGVKIKSPQNYDIFIIDTHPLDQELWQGVKALCALETIIPDGAIGIIVSPLPEGICQSHPQVSENGFLPFEKVKPLVESGKISKIVGHNLVQGGRLLEHTKGYLVSPGVDEKQANQMGFEYFSDIQSAVDAAIEVKGHDAKIMVLGMGGEIAPIIN